MFLMESVVEEVESKLVGLAEDFVRGIEDLRPESFPKEIVFWFEDSRNFERYKDELLYVYDQVAERFLGRADLSFKRQDPRFAEGERYCIELGYFLDRLDLQED